MPDLRHAAPHSVRYPDHVCAACVERATDGDGRGLEFFNPDLLGGFAAAYRDTGERLATPRDTRPAASTAWTALRGRRISAVSSVQPKPRIG